MSVKIRLSITGKTHQVSYRMVAQDTRAKRDGKFLEILGFVNPHDMNNGTKIDKDRIKFFVSRGATFTPSAKYVFENGKLPPRPKKDRGEKEVKAAPPDEPAVKDEAKDESGQASSTIENQPTETSTEEKTTDANPPQEENKPAETKTVEPQATTDTAVDTKESATTAEATDNDIQPENAQTPQVEAEEPNSKNKAEEEQLKP